METQRFEKREGFTRVFAMNFNGFRPESAHKIQQLVRDNKEKEIDRVLISSADASWCTHTKNYMNTKLKVQMCFCNEFV